MIIRNEEELEEALSRPTDADVEAMGALDGDLLLIGISGKMGPSMARLALRASEKAGVKRRVMGAARFSAPGSRDELEAIGVETIPCDLLDRKSVESLPDCPNVLYMVGQKFGTSSNQGLTWAVNSYAPAVACERFASSRIVAFSSGNVYPLTPVISGGPTEQDPVGPVGEYAQSALARERMFQYFSGRNGTKTAILRLNYAIDLRYGVLRDIADQVASETPIDISMGYANVIWQRDANSVALRAFAHVSSPPFLLNLTGSDTISTRAVAEKFGKLLGKEPQF
ncbi:MAG: NAD(P)-dependent oxidoreductase, partial [Acidobacteria bacterium]|nr:NAD(P)-dependent oxidoreductase [Acidobacteriota bacterium]